MKYFSEFWGELVGTFILVFLGCGAVAVSVLFSSHFGLFQVAAIWGIGVTLAIYATRHLSCAHLNPAVSVAMVTGGRMSIRRLPAYVAAQFAGAFMAAAVLYMLFSASIARYEKGHGIVRGKPASVSTAMIFADFYPNPGAGPAAAVTPLNAFLAESGGTFLLVFLIFALTEGCNLGRPGEPLSPLFIGVTVTVIICIIAPLTQAGLNPARDFSPRIFATLEGWAEVAFPAGRYDFLTVYIAGPLSGGIGASLLFTRLLQPLMQKKATEKNCKCD
ncbi:MAG: aquaporin [Candidatus Sulfobium sp.]